MLLNSDVTYFILTFLTLEDILRIFAESISTDYGKKRFVLCITRACFKIQSKLRINWCRQKLERQRHYYDYGNCCNSECDHERLAIFDLTGPVSKTFVISPYCANCARIYSRGLSNVLNTDFYIRS